MYFINSLYVFFHSDHSAKGKKGASSERPERVCEYKYDLKLCTFNVGEKKKKKKDIYFLIWSRMIRKDLTMGSALKVLIL